MTKRPTATTPRRNLLRKMCISTPTWGFAAAIFQHDPPPPQNRRPHPATTPTSRHPWRKTCRATTCCGSRGHQFRLAMMHQAARIPSHSCKKCEDVHMCIPLGKMMDIVGRKDTSCVLSRTVPLHVCTRGSNGDALFLLLATLPIHES